MDIFVRNIPDQLNDKNLEKFFRNQFRPFGIDIFSCRKLKSRGCASLTVLDAEKAQQFLSIYGGSSQKDEKQTKKQALKYMNRDLICAPSRHKSDEMLLRTLRKEAKDKGNQSRNKTSATDSAEQVERKFDYVTLKCGLWHYQASNLVFISQFNDPRRGSIIFGKKNLALVAHSDGIPPGSYRLDVPYSSVQSITTGSFEDPSVTLTLLQAPRVYQESTSDQTSLHYLFGAMGLQMRPLAKPKRRRATSLGGVHESVISTCFVYRIRLADHVKIRPIGLLLQKGWEMPPSIPWPTPVFAPRSSYATEMDRLSAALQIQCSLLGFGLQFQVQRLAQNGYLAPAQVIDLLPHILQIGLRSGGFVGAEAVRKLSRQLPYAGPEVDGEVFAIEHLKKLLSENEKASMRELSISSSIAQQNPHIGLVHKAIVTPAGIYLEGPEPETKNRVLRQYSEHADHFIRVTFCDEDWERMNFARFVSLEDIFHSRFKTILDGVIPIASRRFAFLGFSHSSLREQTCWFMAPFEHGGVILDAATVISKLGNFTAIRCPAKCAARIGQAFSNTDGAVKISSAAVREIPDVERNGRVFSDGVGTISGEILATLWKEYAPARKLKPTLYQIRFAGR
jgi:RNA dependent RNA polymerase